jgi:hypothetical protein
MNTVYENFILESKMTDLLNTKLATRSLMTLDTSLVANAGDTKNINVYTYSGAVETMSAVGDVNTVRGAVTFSATPYVVAVSQQVFDYYDEQLAQDPLLLDMGMKGASTTMVNDINTKYFAELAKGTQTATWVMGEKISYDDIVDGIADMGVEDESQLFIVIGLGLKADIRKDADFKTANAGAILFNGQIGSVAGLPVVVSELVPADTCYIATNKAVTLFTKVDSEVEQSRVSEERKNTVIMRKTELVALTDNTKVVVLTEAVA